MYLAVDIGGTKTLLATITADGEIVHKTKFPSDHNYERFLEHLAAAAKSLELHNIKACCVAVPGLLDRKKGVVVSLGNLPWENKPIRHDVAHALGGLPVVIENDARLAGLSEALLLRDRFNRVLYLTVSTGIGGALIEDGKIVTALEDMEIGKMPLVFKGKIKHWENFAGGHAIVERFGKRAKDIHDVASWQAIGANIGYGVGIACSILQPEAVVFGGGVGGYASNFVPVVKAYLTQHLHAVVQPPKALLQAQRPNEAVVFGCYHYAKTHHAATY